jgi:endonuclease/exonuclease/phosphatase (EEP) superfamily protein YafD
MIGAMPDLTPLTLLTYNLGNGRASPERLLRLVTASQAGVVALQEVSDLQAEALDQGLADLYPQRAIFPGGFAGKALLSQFPIRRAELLLLGDERPDLLVELQLENRTLTVLNAHPPPPRPGRRGVRFSASSWGEIQALVSLARQSDPCLLVGDFNLVPSRREYAVICSQGLSDAFAEAGRGYGATLPRRIGPWKRFLWLNRLVSWVPLPPVLRVDYIWCSPSVTPLEAWVGKDAGSDHLPLLGRVRVG